MNKDLSSGDQTGGLHRHFGLFGGLFGDCGGPYSYPYPPYGPYGYNYCD